MFLQHGFYAPGSCNISVQSYPDGQLRIPDCLQNSRSLVATSLDKAPLPEVHFFSGRCLLYTNIQEALGTRSANLHVQPKA